MESISRIVLDKKDNVLPFCLDKNQNIKIFGPYFSSSDLSNTSNRPAQ